MIWPFMLLNGYLIFSRFINVLNDLILFPLLVLNYEIFNAGINEKSLKNELIFLNS